MAGRYARRHYSAIARGISAFAGDSGNQTCKITGFSFTIISVHGEMYPLSVYLGGFRRIEPSVANQPVFRNIGAQLAVKTEHIVGSSSPRKEGRDKVTGQARYIDDISMPGMIYGATVRSQIPRGRIKKITFGPGIEWNDFAIVSAKDIPGKNHIALITDDQPCLASEFVNHPEEPILLLAHPDRHILPKAVAAISIEYEALPPVFSIEASEQKSHDYLGRGQYFQNLFNSEGRCGKHLGKGRLHRRGRILYRRAGTALYRKQRSDCGVRSGARRDRLGFAAVPLLRAQGADGAFRSAREEKFAWCRRKPAARLEARKNTRQCSRRMPHFSR